MDVSLQFLRTQVVFVTSVAVCGRQYPGGFWREQNGGANAKTR